MRAGKLLKNIWALGVIGCFLLTAGAPILRADEPQEGDEPAKETKEPEKRETEKTDRDTKDVRKRPETKAPVRPTDGAPKLPAGGRPSQMSGGKLVRVEFEAFQGENELGKVVLELDESKAQSSTRNFLRYLDEGFYEGTIIHRVLNARGASIGIIQGGLYIANTEKKTEGIHDPVRNEATNGLKNTRGTIAVARGKDPHSGTCQFFINTKDNPDLDHPGPENWGNWGAAVFGKVVEGMEVIDKIKDTRCVQNPGKPDEISLPAETIRLKNFKRIASEKSADKAIDRSKPPGRADTRKKEKEEEKPVDGEEQTPADTEHGENPESPAKEENRPGR